MRDPKKMKCRVSEDNVIRIKNKVKLRRIEVPEYRNWYDSEDKRYKKKKVKCRENTMEKLEVNE